MSVILRRLNAEMARRGLCSRREADRLIAAGSVRVDGAPAQLGLKVAESARIELVGAIPRQLTVLLHKPVGYESRIDDLHDLLGPDRAWDGDAPIPAALRARLAVAGRLDRSSSGLLVLTNDGRVARDITAGQRLSKTYRVSLAQPVSDAQIAALEHLRRLDEEDLLPMQVSRIDDVRLRFILHQGRKHQIRRACGRFGLRVEALERLAIGRWQLADLPVGCWRYAQAEKGF